MGMGLIKMHYTHIRKSQATKTKQETQVTKVNKKTILRLERVFCCCCLFCQLGKSQSHVGRETLNWENSPTRLACGEAYWAFPWLVIDVRRYRCSSLWLLLPLGWWSLVLEEIRLRNPWGVSQLTALLHPLCSCFCLRLLALDSSVIEVIWWNGPLPLHVTFGHVVLSQQYKP